MKDTGRPAGGRNSDTINLLMNVQKLGEIQRDYRRTQNQAWVCDKYNISRYMLKMILEGGQLYASDGE